MVSLDAASITNVILSSLEQVGLDYRSALVRLGFDGVSIMSGKMSGVQKRIRDHGPGSFCLLRRMLWRQT